MFPSIACWNEYPRYIDNIWICGYPYDCLGSYEDSLIRPRWSIALLRLSSTVYSLQWRVTYGGKWLMPLSLECSPKLSERAYLRCQICHSLFDFHGDLVWWIGDIDAAFWIWVRLGHFFVGLPEAFDPRRWLDKYRLRNWEERTFLSPKIPVVESFGHSSAQLHVLKVVFADRYMCSLTMQNIH